MERNTFDGFPAQFKGTAVPNLFFSAVLPQIDDAAELLDPHLVVQLGIGDAEVHMTKRHAHLIVRRELRVNRMRDEERERNQ